MRDLEFGIRNSEFSSAMEVLRRLGGNSELRIPNSEFNREVINDWPLAETARPASSQLLRMKSASFRKSCSSVVP